MSDTRKPFFTWIEENYTEPAQVPERLRIEMRMLWLNGATVEELGAIFHVPAEWVADFVREVPRTTRPN
jgi:hypothetical protein